MECTAFFVWRGGPGAGFVSAVKRFPITLVGYRDAGQSYRPDRALVLLSSILFSDSRSKIFFNLRAHTRHQNS